MQPAKIKKQDFFNLVTRILPNYAIKRTFPAYQAARCRCRVVPRRRTSASVTAAPEGAGRTPLAGSTRGQVVTATLLPSPEGACPLWTPPTQM